MEILQLTAAQLEERIDAELVENPVLELLAEKPDANTEIDSGMDSEILSPEQLHEQTDSSASADIYEQEPEFRLTTTDEGREEFQIADDFSASYSDTIDELPARSQNWLEESQHRQAEAFANIPTRPQTLQDYLTEQLSWFDLSPEEQSMTERIINNLDRSGYFTYEMDEFLNVKRDSEDHTKEKECFLRALALVRKLDPPGVGAKNLIDCLLLQINQPDSPIVHVEIVRTLILSHLDDIQNNRVPQIVRETNYSVEEIQAGIAELRHLNPRPGAAFAETSVPAIVPDVIVEKNEEGDYVIRLEEGRSSRLTVNDEYRRLLSDKTTEKDTRTYLRSKFGSAQWLLEAIAQRQATLLKVSQAIVEHQRDFLEQGPVALKPLKMQQIAEKVGIHVTTVSRACDDKWLVTQHGLFPLKRFFSSGVTTADGTDDVSQDIVKVKLREIIDRENKSEPLSDDAIVKELESQGIKIARRTVVKYRQSLEIPSSRERRVWQ